MNACTSRRPLSILTLALALTLAGCGLLPTQDDSQKSGQERDERSLIRRGTPALTGEQTQKLLKNATWRWQGNNGAHGTAITHDDGRLRVNWESGGVNGWIRFNESGYCSRFKNLRNNREDCYRLYPTGPNRYDVFRTDGVFTGNIEILVQRAR